jgi:hypothetical protein
MAKFAALFGSPVDAPAEGRNDKLELDGEIMRAALCNLMAALLLIQALTGWCCYHPCAPLASKTAEVTESHRPPCCDDCDGENRPAPEPTVPCSCQDCLGFCTYVPTEKAQVDCPQLVVPFDSLAFAPIPADSHLSGKFFGDLTNGPPVVERPLRLHLLYQIILI